MTENDTARKHRELEMAGRVLIELFGDDAPKKGNYPFDIVCPKNHLKTDRSALRLAWR